jgi:Ca2+/Na+ antiporter
MQPLTVILGIVLGSVFSIAFGLGIVWLIFALRQGEDSRYALELPELARATVLFSLVTVVSALAFLGAVRASTWRRWPILLLILSLAGIGSYYWPV